MAQRLPFERRVRLWAPAARIEDLRADIVVGVDGAPASVRVVDRVELRVFPSTSPKSSAHPLGRLDLIFTLRDDCEAWVATFLDDARWTRRHGLVAWCTANAGAPEDVTTSVDAASWSGAHRRCCCHMHHPAGGCDACDATRLALARSRNARRIRRLIAADDQREREQGQGQGQGQEGKKGRGHDECVSALVVVLLVFLVVMLTWIIACHLSVVNASPKF